MKTLFEWLAFPVVAVFALVAAICGTILFTIYIGAALAWSTFVFILRKKTNQ